MAKENKLSNEEIVIYALFQLGGWKERIHTEDIALECFKLAPSKFSWVKYQQYPDLMAVWYALGSTQQEKYKGMVVGSSERKKGGGKDKIGGWRLTDKGLDWIQENKERVESVLSTGVAPDSRLLEDRKLKSLMKSEAFKQYVLSGDKAEISNAAILESVLCTVNTKSEVVKEKIEQLLNAAVILKQNKIHNYLEYCKKRLNKD